MAYPRYMDSRTNAPTVTTSEPSCMSGQSFKRFSVFISICLAAISLSVGAIATLRPLEPATLKSLQVLNIVLNSASITISAITSLDWRSETEQETKFAKQLLQLVSVHHDGKISLGRRRHHV